MRKKRGNHFLQDRLGFFEKYLLVAKTYDKGGLNLIPVDSNNQASNVCSESIAATYTSFLWKQNKKRRYSSKPLGSGSLRCSSLSFRPEIRKISKK